MGFLVYVEDVAPWWSICYNFFMLLQEVVKLYLKLQLIKMDKIAMFSRLLLAKVNWFHVVMIVN